MVETFICKRKKNPTAFIITLRQEFLGPIGIPMVAFSMDSSHVANAVFAISRNTTWKVWREESFLSTLSEVYFAID